MAFVLCIETATPVCSVALFENDALISLHEIKEGNMHASALTGLIKQCIDNVRLTFNNIDAIAVSQGPGSYTGLRVGTATAKGLCFTLGKPLIAVNTLLSLANVWAMHNKDFGGLICPMIDARRMEVYTALYTNALQEVKPVEAKIIDANSYATELTGNQILFLGSGADKCKSLITHTNAIFIDEMCSAKGMGAIAFKKLTNNEVEDLAYFQPNYLKEFVGK